MESTNEPVEYLRETVARVGLEVEQAMRADLADALRGCDPELSGVLDYGLFSGGKRVRPLLTVLSASLCGRKDSGLYLLAAAMEYLHVATLIHDDVIDNAARRRGRESVVSRFGMAAAILAGDWLHARSMYLVGRLAGEKGLTIFSRATQAMVDGEFLQKRYAGNPGLDREQYYAVIERKTASLMASTCALGAIYADAPDQWLQALTRYGQLLGTAFQVVDDLLDYLGDQAQTGKKVGNDYAEGKVTLPLILARKGADDTWRAEFVRLLQERETTANGWQRMYHLVHEQQGFAQAREEAARLVGEAVASLAVFDQAREEYACLQNLARYILSRNR